MPSGDPRRLHDPGGMAVDLDLLEGIDYHQTYVGLFGQRQGKSSSSSRSPSDLVADDNIDVVSRGLWPLAVSSHLISFITPLPL